jgi:hypothetical protein
MGDGDPYESFPHWNYGILLGLSGEFAGTDREFDAAVRLAPNGQVDIWVAVLRILFALNYQGDVEKAKAVQWFGFPLGARPGLREQSGYADVLKHLDSLQRSP